MRNIIRLIQSFFSSKTSLSFVLTLILVLVLFAIDVIWDTHERISARHFVTDLLIILGVIYLASWIWNRYKSDIASHNKVKNKLHKTSELLKSESIQHKKLKEGIAAHIKEVFDQWKLTNTEREIALLIVKGYSLDEIAKLRHKSERTIRDQAAVIYKKANVKNRIELTSYFIEDLIHLDQF